MSAARSPIKEFLLAVMAAAASQGAPAFSNKVLAAGEVHFDVGSAEIGANEQERLQKFAERAKDHPVDVVIAIGYAATNEMDPIALSEGRAAATRLQLLELGFPPWRIYTEGQGAIRPANNDLARQRRVEIDSQGQYSFDLRNFGANPLRTWHLESRSHAKPDLTSKPADQWSSMSPLQFFPFITNEASRQRFLRQYRVVAVGERDDNLLKTLLALSQPSDADSVAALMALMFGTPFAKTTFAVALEQIDTTKPEVRQFALRAWCGSHSQAPFKPIVQQAAIQRMLAMLDPAEQVRWVECAAQRADAELLPLLKSNGVNLNAQDAHGRTALHRTVGSADLSAVKVLLDSGADPNVRDADGRTALHDVRFARGWVGMYIPATEATRMAMWTALIGAGADRSIIDKNGKPPLP